MKKVIFAVLALSGLIKSTIGQVPSYVPTSGLIAWWPFTGNANDESGNGNHGTVISAAPDSDRYGTSNCSYLFKKTMFNEITVPTNTTFNNLDNISISLWVKLKSYGAPMKDGYNHYINKSDQINNHQFVFANNNIQYYFYYGGGTEVFATTTMPPLNQWCNLAVTYNYNNGKEGSECKFYIDGIAVDSMITTKFLNHTTDGIRIGTYANESGHRVDGNLDDIGIWSRALTPQEVNTLHNSSPLSILNFASNNQLSVYPNPATDHISIKADDILIGSSYVIYNNIGKLIYTGIISKENMILRLDGISSGIYFINIGGKYGQSFSVINE